MRLTLNSLRMMLLSAVFFLLASFLSTSYANDLELPLRSTGSIIFHTDLYRYVRSKNTTLLEIAYSLDLLQFTPVTENNNPIAVFTIDLQLFPTPEDSPLIVNEKKRINISEVLKGNSAFFDLKKFGLHADSVLVKISIMDSVSNKKGYLEEKIHVSKFTDALSVSDIFFASHVQKAVDESNFNKGGLFLLPNSSRVYALSDVATKGYIYFEINNLTIDENRSSSYSVHYSVEDLTGKELVSHHQPSIVKTSENSARLEVIPLSDLSAGQYRLSVFVEDLLTNESCTTFRYFNVFSEETQSMDLPMTKEDIEKYYDQIKYIATHDEKEIYKSLPPEGIQQFLLNFWQRRDPDLDTPENEGMIEHFKNMEYCKNNIKGGLDSDMARIYLKYGPPVDIVRNAYTLEFTRPVETWIYAIEGRVEFIFVDRWNDGRYVLVHSTHRDEFQNVNWMDNFQ